ncbi:MAG: NPCBM/NEW2 domain-containing protein [Planctomycetales bacterium]|nr:NPCBM/NEW2 domain-containing protein [Planctomycetales bacterium]
MSNLLLLSLLGLIAADAQIKPLSGPTVSGSLEQLAPEQIVLGTPAGPKSFRGADLFYLSLPDAKPVADFEPTVWLRLVDGSVIVGSSFTATSDAATVGLAGGQSLEIPTRQIHSVRFHSASNALTEQWAEAVDKDVRGDRLVVRKSPESINYLEGLIAEVDAKVVNFRYEGSDVKAPRERLEGLVYFHALKPDFAAPVCRVHDANGCVWQAKSFAASDQSVEVTCLSNVRVSLPLGQIDKFDFSTGNLVFLSDLEPQTSEWTPWFASATLPEALSLMYSPKRDRSFANGPMLLRQQGDQVSYDKGLSLHSRTKLTYRLTGDHRKLVAQVGMDARVGSAGHVELTITGDNRELFKREITGADEAFPLDVDISGVRRLEILVDYGKNMDLADHLNLCDAMLTQ